MELNSGCLKMYLTSLLFRKPHWCVSANHFVSKATMETVAIKMEFVTLLGHWTQGMGKIRLCLEFPKASYKSVLNISWPGSRHPNRAALSTLTPRFAARTPALGPAGQRDGLPRCWENSCLPGSLPSWSENPIRCDFLYIKEELQEFFY